MRRIALIEPYDHSEVLYSLCELLLIQPEVKLYIFTQQYIRDHAPEPISNAVAVTWFTFKPEKRTAFFQGYKSKLNDCDLILWITAVAPLRWINNLGLEPPLVLIIHNRYTWFDPIRHLYPAWCTPYQFLVSLIRVVRLLVVQRAEQKKMLGWVAAVAFPSRNVFSLALQSGHLPASGKAFYLPFGCFMERPARTSDNDTDIVRIVVPGTVTNNGRDYNTLARAFKEVVPQLGKTVELTLLGQVKMGKITLRKLQKIQGKRFRLQTFDSWIPQKDYDIHLRNADFLILPFEPFRRFGIIKESLGISAVSGGVSDMVRFGIPAICSIYYHLDDELEQLVERYNSPRQLAELLHSWIVEEKYLLARRRMDKALEPFRCENAGPALWHQLESLQKTS